MLFLSAISNIMKSKTTVLLPTAQQALTQLGEDLKLARLRRKLSGAMVAERAGISRSTLWQIEKGSPSVAMGAYVQVLFILGLERNLLALASNDELGRKLQDAQLLVKKRAPKRTKKMDDQNE